MNSISSSRLHNVVCFLASMAFLVPWRAPAGLEPPPYAHAPPQDQSSAMFLTKIITTSMSNMDDDNCKNWLLSKVLLGPMYTLHTQKGYEEIGVSTLYTVQCTWGFSCFVFNVWVFYQDVKWNILVKTKHKIFLFYANMESAIKLLSNTLTKHWTVQYTCAVYFLCSLPLFCSYNFCWWTQESKIQTK
jgi:hypothetical protein